MRMRACGRLRNRDRKKDREARLYERQRSLREHHGSNNDQFQTTAIPSSTYDGQQNNTELISYIQPHSPNVFLYHMWSIHMHN